MRLTRSLTLAASQALTQNKTSFPRSLLTRVELPEEEAAPQRYEAYATGQAPQASDRARAPKSVRASLPRVQRLRRGGSVLHRAHARPD